MSGDSRMVRMVRAAPEEDEDPDEIMAEGEEPQQEQDEEEDDDDEMELSVEEILAAHTIKESLQSANEDSNSEYLDLHLQPLSDFEYVQYALCAEDDTPEKKLERIACMQAFKEEYNINDTVEEGMELLDACSKFIPGFYLHFEKIRPENVVFMVTHWTKLDAKKIRGDPKGERLFLGSMYYSLQLRMCNFHAIRSGSWLMIEFGGSPESDLQGLDFQFLFDRFVHGLYAPYPWSIEKKYVLNSPTAYNCVCNSYKQLLNPGHLERTHFGYLLPGLQQGIQIDSYFKIPTAEVGRQRMLNSAKALLEERYHNQKKFVLPE